MRSFAAHLRKLVALTGLTFVVATTTATMLTPQPASAECSTPPAAAPASTERAPPAEGSAESGASPPAPQPEPPRERRLVGTLNLNTAGVEQLELLPGVGPAKAARIVAFRERRGEFERVVDLRRVRGFGRKTVRRLLPYLTTDGESTLRRE